MTEIPSQATEIVRRRGAIAVVCRADRLLVIRRSAQVVAAGKLCFPGGCIEPGESEEQALVREFQEELGASIRQVRCVWRSATRWHVELAWWLGEPGPEDLVPNPADVAEVHWMTPAEMLAQVDLLESNRAFLAALAASEIVLE